LLRALKSEQPLSVQTLRLSLSMYENIARVLTFLSLILLLQMSIGKGGLQSYCKVTYNTQVNLRINYQAQNAGWSAGNIQ
jgi:hypothetical protein